jgi:hypothetical protein
MGPAGTPTALRRRRGPSPSPPQAPRALCCSSDDFEEISASSPPDLRDLVHGGRQSTCRNYENLLPGVQALCATVKVL